ncbi:MAG: OmpA family protein [Burkholderiales bacterium]
MPINLFEMLKSTIAPEIVKQTTHYLGESEASIKAAVDSIMPTLVGGLMQSGKTAEGAGKLLNLINSGPSIDTSMLANLTGLFSGGERTGTLLGIGGTLIRSLFGDKADSINAALSGMNNMKAGSGGSLMAMATPLLFGMLKNHVSTHQLDSGGLMKLLSAQAQHVAPALSDKTTYAMGLGSVAAFLGGGPAVGVISAKKPTANISAGASAAAPVTAGSNSSNDVALNAMNAMNSARDVSYTDDQSGDRWWKKILPIALLVLAGYFAFNYFIKGREAGVKTATGNSPEAGKTASAKTSPVEAPIPATETAKPAIEAAKPSTEIVREVAATAAGIASSVAANGMKSFNTPGGGKIDVALNSIGDRLLTAITTPAANLKKAFNLDKLLFNSDSADLGSDGRKQLQEVATILKAFTSVEIRLNGHTDNSGDPAGNKILSGNRAAVVKEELAKLGVAANRISTDSFSSSQPIASNATEAGRRQNRRVELAITKR